MKPLLMVGAAASVFMLGCQTEERIIRAQPTLLQNIPGAVGGLNEDGSARDPTQLPASAGGDAALAMTAADLVKTNPDGSKTLVSKIIQHTIYHLVHALREEDDELLYTQVLSDATRRHYSEQGENPREAIVYFKENKDDIIAMLSRMPNAENTPGVITEKVGRRDFRLRITGTAAKGLKFTEYWVTMERGNWRVVWVQ